MKLYSWPSDILFIKGHEKKGFSHPSMGITGLIPLLKPILISKSLREYREKTFGIDGNVWLYKICYIYAEHIYHRIPIKKHAKDFIQKINGLRCYNIKPIVVFDGDPLKAKEITNNERKKRKLEIRAEIEQCLLSGNAERATFLMRQCISINNDILSPVLDILRHENIEFIFAPHESDAQLVYLEKINYIDYIVTEDSDLVVFGARKVLFKFDGSTVCEYDYRRLPYAKDSFFATNIRDIAILSGCDYLKSVKGIGLLTAYKLLKKHRTVEKCLEYFRSVDKLPADYAKNYDIAVKNFTYAIVYDPLSKVRVHLTDPRSCKSISDYDLGVLNHPDPGSFAIGNHVKKVVGPIQSLGAKESNHQKLPRRVVSSRVTIPKLKKTKIKKAKVIVVDEDTDCSLFKTD